MAVYFKKIRVSASDTPDTSEQMGELDESTDLGSYAAGIESEAPTYGLQSPDNEEASLLSLSLSLQAKIEHYAGKGAGKQTRLQTGVQHMVDKDNQVWIDTPGEAFRFEIWSTRPSPARLGSLSVSFE